MIAGPDSMARPIEQGNVEAVADVPPGGHRSNLETTMHPSLKLVLVCLLAPIPLLAKTPLHAQPPKARVVKTAAQEKDKGEQKKEKAPDVIFVPTPQVVVDKMLEMAEVKKGDVLYDLGCGDGRIVVTAAKKHGVKATGIDIDPERIKESLENVRKNDVGHLVTIKRADIFEEDLTPASVVTLYLLPELNVRLMPQLRKLKPGTRIVSHDFDMKGAKPKKVVTVQDGSEESEHTVYLWVVPWEEEKP
jgi:SAM-dependent methyltransferase